MAGKTGSYSRIQGKMMEGGLRRGYNAHIWKICEPSDACPSTTVVQTIWQKDCTCLTFLSWTGQFNTKDIQVSSIQIFKYSSQRFLSIFGPSD